jgi:vacuolar-type H+-ATPase subunit I/STV1
MTILKLYLAVSAGAFFVLSFAWKERGILNLAIKTTLFFLGIVGMLLFAQALGYVVKQ